MNTAGRILSSSALSFTSFRALNDPFETLAVLRNSPTRREAVTIYTSLKEGGADTPDEILRYLEESHERDTQMRAELRATMNSLGVLCLSANPHDLLMWAHYAHAHQGVMIEFDAERLEDSLQPRDVFRRVT